LFLTSILVDQVELIGGFYFVWFVGVRWFWGLTGFCGGSLVGVKGEGKSEGTSRSCAA
jgi:hypothetical protein